MHEDFVRAHEMQRSNDRSFGFAFAAVFGIIGLWPLIHLQLPRWWALAIGTAIVVTAILRPSLLAPVHRAVAPLARLLQRIVFSIMASLIFCLAVVPTGIILRLAGKDPLRTRWEKSAETYWIARKPPGPAPEAMKNQL